MNGAELLLNAKKQGELEIEKWLCSQGVGINEEMGDIELLGSAYTQGEFEIAKWILKQGADINKGIGTGDEEMTLLHHFVLEGNLPLIRHMVRNGADPKLVCWEEAPLHTASHKGYLPIVRFLLENGEDANRLGNHRTTSLNYASQYGHLDVVQLLLERGADPNLADAEEYTPLHSAISKGHWKTVQLLLDGGATLSMKAIRDNKTGLTLALKDLSTVVVEDEEVGEWVRKINPNLNTIFLDEEKLKNYKKIATEIGRFCQSSKDPFGSWIKGLYGEKTEFSMPTEITEMIFSFLGISPVTPDEVKFIGKYMVEEGLKSPFKLYLYVEDELQLLKRHQAKLQSKEGSWVDKSKNNLSRPLQPQPPQNGR